MTARNGKDLLREGDLHAWYGDSSMKTGMLVLLVIVAVVLSGCTTLSSEIVTPRTRPGQPATVSVSDCFYLVNQSSHGADTGSSQEITVTGYVSNICSTPIENLTVRGIFSDKDGHAFASADDFVGHVGYHEMAAFSVTIDTDYTDLYTYRVTPVVQVQQKFF
jgi:starvation-inducible outer membrane lipoprotein